MDDLRPSSLRNGNSGQPADPGGRIAGFGRRGDGAGPYRRFVRRVSSLYERAVEFRVRGEQDRVGVRFSAFDVCDSDISLQGNAVDQRRVNECVVVDMTRFETGFVYFPAVHLPVVFFRATVSIVFARVKITRIGVLSQFGYQVKVGLPDDSVDELPCRRGSVVNEIIRQFLERNKIKILIMNFSLTFVTPGILCKMLAIVFFMTNKYHNSQAFSTFQKITEPLVKPKYRQRQGESHMDWVWLLIQ
jgi:hypothetical protein